MKKTIVSALVLSALSGSVLAGFKVDVNNESKTSGKRESKQTLVLSVSEGLGFGEVEVNTDKDIELTAGMKLELTPSFYVKPTLGYLFNGSDNKKNGTVEDFAFKASGLSSDVFKVGAEAGFEFENGFYTSARYRVESNVEAMKLSVSDALDPSFGQGKNEFTAKGERSIIGRTDLTAGYKFDLVTIQAKAIHKDQLSRKYKKDEFAPQLKNHWSSELKATLTMFDGVQPYLELSSDRTYRKGFDDNKVKLGAAFSF